MAPRSTKALDHGFLRLLTWPMATLLLSFCSLAFAQDPASPVPAVPTPAQEVSKATNNAFPASKIRETLIAEATAGSEISWARSTENHIAWVEKANGKKTVRLDGKQIGASYEDVKYLTHSSDEQHLGFIAKRNSKWVMVVDGEDRSRDYGRMTAPHLSANGKTFAVGACNEKKCHLVVDNAEIGADYEDISVPGFSPDGSHHIYFGKRNKKWVMVLDDKESGPEMDDYYTWEFTPDGNRNAVAAFLKRHWTWIVDGVPGPSFEVIGSLEFSPDGKHFAYGGADEKTGFAKHAIHGALVVDGQTVQNYDGRGFGGGWAGVFGPQESMVTGVRSLSPDFHGVSDPQYTSEGRLVYAARRGESDVVVFTDSKAGPSFEDIVSSIVVTTDGKHSFYVAKRGESFVEVRDNQPGVSFPGKREVSFVGMMMMTKDGSHFAYEIVRGGKMFKAGGTTRALRRLVLDSQAGPGRSTTPSACAIPGSAKTESTIPILWLERKETKIASFSMAWKANSTIPCSATASKPLTNAVSSLSSRTASAFSASWKRWTNKTPFAIARRTAAPGPGRQ
jgi:hypothetical protein